MAKITRSNPDTISKPFSNYSHVVTAEGAQKLVFCAGQVAADVDGKVLPPDNFAAQAKMVMANLTSALAAGGAKLSDVTKITIYICNPHDVPKARGILQEHFGGRAPLKPREHLEVGVALAAGLDRTTRVRLLGHQAREMLVIGGAAVRAMQDL